MLPDNVTCGVCQSANYYVRTSGAALQCRDCGNFSDIDPITWDLFPKITELKRAIWKKVKEKLPRLQELQEMFNFQYAQTPEQQYFKYVNIYQYLDKGKQYTITPKQKRQIAKRNKDATKQ